MRSSHGDVADGIHLSWLVHEQNCSLYFPHKLSEHFDTLMVETAGCSNNYNSSYFSTLLN